MSIASAGAVREVEARNDALARAYDIDAYYQSANAAVRWIEQGRLRTIVAMAAAKPEDRILEIGCGGGHVLRLFPACQLTGVDVSSEMLAKARRNLAACRVRLLKGETHQLDLADQSFDTVICTEVLEHVDDPDRILMETTRLVRPQGRVIITLPNDHLIRRLKTILRVSRADRLPFLRNTSWGGDEYHLHIWTIAEMRALLRRYFVILREALVPFRCFPIRCCFLCARHECSAAQHGGTD